MTKRVCILLFTIAFVLMVIHKPGNEMPFLNKILETSVSNGTSYIKFVKIKADNEEGAKSDVSILERFEAFNRSSKSGVNSNIDGNKRSSYNSSILRRKQYSNMKINDKLNERTSVKISKLYNKPRTKRRLRRPRKKGSKSSEYVLLRKEKVPKKILKKVIGSIESDKSSDFITVECVSEPKFRKGFKYISKQSTESAHASKSESLTSKSNTPNTQEDHKRINDIIGSTRYRPNYAKIQAHRFKREDDENLSNSSWSKLSTYEKMLKVRRLMTRHYYRPNEKGGGKIVNWDNLSSQERLLKITELMGVGPKETYNESDLKESAREWEKLTSQEKIKMLHEMTADKKKVDSSWEKLTPSEKIKKIHVLTQKNQESGKGGPENKLEGERKLEKEEAEKVESSRYSPAPNPIEETTNAQPEIESTEKTKSSGQTLYQKIKNLLSFDAFRFSSSQEVRPSEENQPMSEGIKNSDINPNGAEPTQAPITGGNINPTAATPKPEQPTDKATNLPNSQQQNPTENYSFPRALPTSPEELRNMCEQDKKEADRIDPPSMNEDPQLQQYQGYGPIKTLSESVDHRTSKQIRLQKAVHKPGWKKLTFDQKMDIIDEIMDSKFSKTTSSDEITLEDIKDEGKEGEPGPW